MQSFSKLDNVYLCLWVIFDKYISRVILTKTIYFVRYCNKRNSTENRIEAKVNVVQIQENSYPDRTQLNEIYQHRVVPQKLWKKGVPKRIRVIFKIRRFSFIPYDISAFLSEGFLELLQYLGYVHNINIYIYYESTIYWFTFARVCTW